MRSATTLRIGLFFAVALLATPASILTLGADSVHAADATAPVLVELFTSEGCSSCPPADRLLQKLDGQPLPGAEMIVLSEHVDYWNHIGWKDPYSSRFYSDRQSVYAKRFGLDSVYTPQMVVNGSSQFVGSNSELADKAFARELGRLRLAAHLSSISAEPSNTLRAHLETGTLDSALGSQEAEVYIAVALNHAESQVSAGENAGHKLVHVSVVRSLAKIGVLKPGQSLAQDIRVKVEPGADPHNLRLIAFIQERMQGRILGATAAPVLP